MLGEIVTLTRFNYTSNYISIIAEVVNSITVGSEGDVSRVA